MALTSLLVATCLLLNLQGAVSAPTNDNQCCLPEQFENKLASNLGQVVPKVVAQGFFLNGTMHADFTNQRIAVYEEVTTDTYKANLTVIEDIKGKVMYVFTKSTKSCIKIPLPDTPMFPSKPCTNKNFTFMGTQKLGMADESLDVNMYQVKTKSPYSLLELYLTKTKCLPVFELSMASYLGTPQVQGQIYSDITLGIKDPSVFNVPDYCKKSMSVGTNVFVKDAISRHHARRGMWA